jgi:hypothetical protein
LIHWTIVGCFQHLLFYFKKFISYHCIFNLNFLQYSKNFCLLVFWFLFCLEGSIKKNCFLYSFSLLISDIWVIKKFELFFWLFSLLNFIFNFFSFFRVFELPIFFFRFGYFYIFNLSFIREHFHFNLIYLNIMHFHQYSFFFSNFFLYFIYYYLHILNIVYHWKYYFLFYQN